MIPLAVLAAAPALAQLGTGLVQSNRAKKILNGLNRPTYDIPEAATEALGTARTMASTNQLPNQVQAQQGLDQASANALYGINQNAQSGTEALAALSGVYSNQMAGQNQLAGQAANFTAQQNQNLIGELGRYAAYQEKQFDINQMQPYMMKVAEAQGLGGAGMQNKYNAFKDITGIGVNALAGMVGMGNNQGSPNPTVDALKSVLGSMGNTDVASQAPSTNMANEIENTNIQEQVDAAVRKEQGGEMGMFSPNEAAQITLQSRLGNPTPYIQTPMKPSLNYNPSGTPLMMQYADMANLISLLNK